MDKLIQDFYGNKERLFFADKLIDHCTRVVDYYRNFQPNLLWLTVAALHESLEYETTTKASFKFHLQESGFEGTEASFIVDRVQELTNYKKVPLEVSIELKNYDYERYRPEVQEIVALSIADDLYRIGHLKSVSFSSQGFLKNSMKTLGFLQKARPEVLEIPLKAVIFAEQNVI